MASCCGEGRETHNSVSDHPLEFPENFFSSLDNDFYLAFIFASEFL